MPPSTPPIELIPVNAETWASIQAWEQHLRGFARVCHMGHAPSAPLSLSISLCALGKDRLAKNQLVVRPLAAGECKPGIRVGASLFLQYLIRVFRGLEEQCVALDFEDVRIIFSLEGAGDLVEAKADSRSGIAEGVLRCLRQLEVRQYSGAMLIVEGPRGELSLAAAKAAWRLVLEASPPACHLVYAVLHEGAPELRATLLTTGAQR